MNPDIKPASVKAEHKPVNFTNYFILVIVALVVVVGAGLILYFHHHQSNNTAFTIDGQVTTKATYNALLSSAATHHVSASTAKTEIITIKKDQYVAPSLNLSPTQASIDSSARSQFVLSPTAKLDSWEQLLGWNVAFNNLISLDQTGGYQGAIFFFPFNDLQEISGPSFPKAAGWGNPADIAAAQQYAQSEANSYYGKLKSNAMTDDQVINELLTNSKLQFAGSTNNSTDFSVNTSGYTPVNGQASSTPLDPSSISLIQTTKQTGLTPIETESSTVQGYLNYTGQTTTIKSDYYFIDLQKILKPNANIESTLKQDVSQLVVKTNV